MKMKLHLCIALFFLLILAACDGREEGSRYGKDESGELLAMSFPRVSLGEKERIVGLEISIHHGSVKAIGNIPEGWSIELNADPSWNSMVSGSVQYGAGALNDLSELDSLLVIRPWRGKHFTFSVEASVMTTADFEKITKRSFGMADLIFLRKK